MINPWWTETTGTYIALFGGAGLGMIGGVLGAGIGMLAPQGKCKTLVFASVGLILTFCAVLFFTGLTALIMGQPRHVWYGPLLIGGIGSMVFGCLSPIIVTRYRQADARRFDAEALKRS